MKEFSKKISLCFVILLGVLVMNLMVPERVWAANSDFVIDENGVLTKYNGDATEVIIPSGVTHIKSSAFSNDNNVETIVIPDSVNLIDTNSIRGKKLVNIMVDKNNTAFSDINGVLFNKQQTILIYYPKGRFGVNYKIPNGVTSIDDYAFSGSRLTIIGMSDSITSIGNYAFANCSDLTNLTLPNNLISIGNFAFYQCNSLIKLKIPDTVTSIGEYAFFNCSSLESINISNAMTSISNSTFYACQKLKNINIPSNITSIENYAFCNCYNLTSIEIQENVRFIGRDAFAIRNNIPISIFIYNDNITLGNLSIYLEDKDFIILYGNKGSVAEMYAQQYGHRFVELSNDIDKPLKDISLNKSMIHLNIGKTSLLSVIYNPDDTSDDKTVTWTSSNREVAIVYTNGKVKAIGKGTAVITAKVGNLTATCNVTVTE